MNVGRVIDISPAISERSSVWPGDTPYVRRVLLDMHAGANITLSNITTTVHLGAHADGVNHYLRDGAAIDAMPLKHYLGVCRVLHAVNTRRGSRIGIDDVDLGPLPLPPRVLLATGSFDGFDAWNEDFAGLEPALVEHLADRGVITVGVDTPSVDIMTSKDLPAHAACARGGVAILEGLALASVEPGDYELIALPLKLVGADASPVRAVLRTL